ncbi:PLP-dependent aminotransferase family protein [Pigmentiphaga aceris]|uniref:PLP-dependent aminotransferase family protein n=1 Tax=Pigmentiphaga aceris TaxID=1940612 RepID=A0A5C0B0L0_9BURK|nr:PLP-dependent aminotransferase family protein [Pigmentiphaga aceris]QEI06381.1 PLP-dependent aminotransferase family protein [Pigmentiphaga aceris]
MDKQSPGRKLKNPNRAWIRPFEDGAGSRYLQIARQIIAAVDDGVLRPGDRLPPQRDLAQAMGVDLTTVTRAYTEVRTAGLLDAHGAGGTFIASSVSDGDRTVDLGMNIPPLLMSPAFTRLMDTGMTSLREQLGGGDLMSYHVGAGARTDREAAAVWLRPVLGAVSADRVVVCPGAQSALTALMLARTQPGDMIAADGLTYPGFLAAARVLQRGVAPVASDDEGMLPDDLDRVCQTARPRLIYLIPTIHNPMATTLSAQRRADIYKVASRHGVAIVEDDPYWLLAGDAPPPLATLQSGEGAPVFYISTLSKCLAPGLRTGYLVVPPSEPLEPILDALRAVTLMAPHAMVAMATHWIGTGQAGDILQKIRQELAQRQKIAARILPGILHSHPYGLHLWLGLSPKLDQYRLIQTARERNLGVASSDAFSFEDVPPHAIRVSLGGASDQASLKAALEKLAEILASDPRQRTGAIV